MYCNRTWRSTSQSVFNLVNSSLKQRTVMEMLGKQDCRHYCLWAHHLLRRIIASGQCFCSIFCKAALSSLVWSQQAYSSSNGDFCFHLIPSRNSWVNLPGWCLSLLRPRRKTSFQKNHWSPYNFYDSQSSRAIINDDSWPLSWGAGQVWDGGCWLVMLVRQQSTYSTCILQSLHRQV